MLATATRPIGSEQDSLQLYRRDVERYDLLNSEEERRLLYDVRDGRPGALDQLVQRNLRLVIFVARRYQRMGVPLADLVNEGNIGLIEGARRFDADRGNSFASYAFYWIRQAIRKAVMDQRSTIRIPVYRQNRLRKAIKEQRERAAGGQPIDRPTAEFPESQFRMIPLSGPCGGGPQGEGRTVAETVADERVEDPLERVAREKLRGDVARALCGLSERQSTVLRLYYGLGGAQPCTLAEIGDTLGVTKEYIRQIRNTGLARLRQSDTSRALRSYV